MRAYASGTPGITAELRAQAAHGPSSDLARADVVRATLTRATRVATRSPPCAMRSTGARGSTGPGTTSPTGLPRSYPSGAPEGDAKAAPVSTAGRSRHRSRHAMTTRRKTARARRQSRRVSRTSRASRGARGGHAPNNCCAPCTARAMHLRRLEASSPSSPLPSAIALKSHRTPSTWSGRRTCEGEVRRQVKRQKRARPERARSNALVRVHDSCKG